MDEPLEERVDATARRDHVPVQIVLEDVARRDHLRRLRTGEQEAVGMLRVACAHVAVAVENALIGEDAVGGDQVIDDLGANVGRVRSRVLGVRAGNGEQDANDDDP